MQSDKARFSGFDKQGFALCSEVLGLASKAIIRHNQAF
jgi:hypothetical protein